MNFGDIAISSMVIGWAVFIWMISIAVPLIIAYFVIKAGVRNGVIQALYKLKMVPEEKSKTLPKLGANTDRL